MLKHVIALSIAVTATLAQDTLRVDVNVVRVPVSVTRRGVPVKGLTKDIFQLREDSTPQTIQYFWQEHDLPLSVGLMWT